MRANEIVAALIVASMLLPGSVTYFDGSRVVVDLSKWDSRISTFLRRRVAALHAYALLIPYIAAILAVVLNSKRVDLPGGINSIVPSNDFLAGVFIALAIWILLALLPNQFLDGQTINRGSYAEASSRVQALRETVRKMDQNDIGSDVALSRSVHYTNQAENDLKRQGLQWFWGNGYISVWKTIHRAEEELIRARVPDDLVRDAQFDWLRLQGSAVPRRDLLSRSIKLAMISIRSSLSAIFDQVPQISATARRAIKRDTPSLVANVRHSINAYRDEQWQSVIQIRNQLLVATLITELGALLILGLAICATSNDQADDYIMGASAIFLVGAVVGLFAKLHEVIGADSSVDDYGLVTARLFATPLYSGLAALGGVLIVAVLPSVIDVSSISSEPTEAAIVATSTATEIDGAPSDMPTITSSAASPSPPALPTAAGEPSPTASAALDGGSEALAVTATPEVTPQETDTSNRDSPPPSLRTVYSIGTLKLLVAAFFGYLPAQFFSRLGQVDLKRLSASEASGARPVPTNGSE